MYYVFKYVVLYIDLHACVEGVCVSIFENLGTYMYVCMYISIQTHKFLALSLG